MAQPSGQIDQKLVSPGLRDRKKAKRRELILDGAEKLFAEQGFDATTVNMIADEVGISAPTVFNYFGSKDNILAALIFEGADKAHAINNALPRKTNVHFADVVTELLVEVTDNTMNIAGKRVWRYAEAANIRRPHSEFEKQFARVDKNLIVKITNFLRDYDIRLRNGQDPDYKFLAQLIFDRWSMRYLDYIKDDAMPMKTHAAQIRADIKAIFNLVLDDAFAKASPLRKRAGG